MKTIIAGGREFGDYGFLCDCMNTLRFEVHEIVSGKARGADTLGERWATETYCPIKEFPADWDKHGKAAGPIRNSEMANYAEALVAFWDGKSKGTKNMIETAAKKGLYVKVFFYDQQD
jgi:hypothetical protein